MPQYQYDINLNKRRRFVSRYKKFLMICLVCLILVGVGVVVDIFRQKEKEIETTGAPIVTAVSSSIKTFSTSYFTFTASNLWNEIKEETTSTRFVYRSTKAGLIEQQITIYVNEPAPDLLSTRALPVRIVNGNHIIPNVVSEHCKTAAVAEKATAQAVVRISDTKILCWLDGNNYVVSVGEIGADTNLNLTRSGGDKGIYNFIYRSSTVPANPSQLISILNSFKPI